MAITEQRKIENKLWRLCKKIIRGKYGNKCYTCKATNLQGRNWHTGHMYPKGSLSAFLKYDLRILRPQCYNCNINHGGMGAVFLENMTKREGTAYVEQIRLDKLKTVKAIDHYKEILPEYIELAKEY